jgi:chromosome partitioning protein
MQSIVLASQKGGVGKTTLAGHLAVAAERWGRVAIIDTDPQGGLAGWWNERRADTPVFLQLRGGLAHTLQAAAARRLDLVVIDTPPQASRAIADTIAVADLVIVPVRPSPHDLRAIGATLALTDAAAKPVLVVINAAAMRSRLYLQTLAALRERRLAPVTVRARAVLAAAMTDGRTAAELDGASDAAADIEALTVAALAALGRPRARRRRA